MPESGGRCVTVEGGCLTLREVCYSIVEKGKDICP